MSYRSILENRSFLKDPLWYKDHELQTCSREQIIILDSIGRTDHYTKIHSREEITDVSYLLCEEHHDQLWIIDHHNWIHSGEKITISSENRLLMCVCVCVCVRACVRACVHARVCRTCMCS